MNHKTPFDLKELKGSEPWFCGGSLYSASEEQGLAQRKLIEEAFNQKVQELRFNDFKDNEHTLGVPTSANELKSTYWRKKTSIPEEMNPDLDRCGVLWLCPLLPFDGQDVVSAVQISESIIKSYKFEPNIGIRSISARSIYMYIAIMYDRDVLLEDERAKKCHDQLLSALIEKGYLPYRLGIQSMDCLPPVQDDYGRFLKTIKQSLEPNDILAPGRYDFRKDWT